MISWTYKFGVWHGDKAGLTVYPRNNDFVLSITTKQSKEILYIGSINWCFEHAETYCRMIQFLVENDFDISMWHPQPKGAKLELLDSGKCNWNTVVATLDMEDDEILWQLTKAIESRLKTKYWKDLLSVVLTLPKGRRFVPDESWLGLFKMLEEEYSWRELMKL